MVEEIHADYCMKRTASDAQKLLAETVGVEDDSRVPPTNRTHRCITAEEEEMRKYFLALAFLAFASVLIAQQAINNESVIKMMKAGLSDEIIITTINGSPGAYNTTPEGLIALKQAGVTDKVIAAIVSKSSGAAQPQVPPIQSSSPNTNDAAAPNPPAPASLLASDTPAAGTAVGSKPIAAGSRIVIAPMGGFETYFAAAVRRRKFR